MTINVGIVGYGLSGSAFHAPIISVVDGLTLKAIVTSQADKVLMRYPHVTTYAAYDELLADDTIDLVVVTTPTFTHYNYVKEAILHKKYVIVEKPFTVTAAEADDLITLAEQYQVLLSVYQNRRYDNDFLTVKDILHSHILGNLALFESHMDRYRHHVQNRWKEQDKPGSGSLYDLGSHLIDQAIELFGTPQTVYADLASQRPAAMTNDYFHLILSYGSLRVILQSGSLVRQPGPRFTLHGENGSFTKFGLDPQENALRQGDVPYTSHYGLEDDNLYGKLQTTIDNLTITGKVTTLKGCYEKYYEGIVQAILGTSRVPVTAMEARKVIRTIELAIESHKQQRVVLWSE